MAEEIRFHSIDEIRAYVKQEVERQQAIHQKKTEGWHLAKKVMWLLLLVTAYVQYYFIDIMYTTITLPTLEVSVPVAKQPPKMRT